MHHWIHATIATALLATAPATALTRAPAAAVPGGVYDCYGTYGIDTGKFSVLAPGKYMSRGGGIGTFTFDGTMLTMVTGPYEGMRYRKETPNWTFRLQRDTGGDGPFSCPRNVTKDVRKPNSW